MVDFILRHGNDLLAVECLRGFEVMLSSSDIIIGGCGYIVYICVARVT